ncbi:M15 family metallopeptidase [Aquimarina sp. ERC-38]|uniref:M15 family metallopeptidase n=1 Tax=Aquimarina sp. ERC-38 TaxID=2949996 RepID=UPI0022456B0A|nr:M15 family metallopeptidase [Aquimarina sp. ERC-38]UZO82583.1 M15 family metallopeptidase [Aquimarina sp. ERC-38]
MVYKKPNVRLLFLLVSILVTKVTGQDYSTEQLLGKDRSHLTKTKNPLHPKAAEAFEQMKKAAKKEGILISIASGHRSYKRQQEIWDAKYRRFTKNGLTPTEAVTKIVEYSTIPGTSRHHWGTDIDLIDAKPKQPEGLLLAENYEPNGVFCKLKEWMDQHAATFGYFLVYTNKTDRKGFKYEPWHYSYAPVSVPLLAQYKKIALDELIRSSSIKGKEAFTTEFIASYRNNNLLDINPILLPDQ